MQDSGRAALKVVLRSPRSGNVPARAGPAGAGTGGPWGRIGRQQAPVTGRIGIAARTIDATGRNGRAPVSTLRRRAGRPFPGGKLFAHAGPPCPIRLPQPGHRRLFPQRGPER